VRGLLQMACRVLLASAQRAYLVATGPDGAAVTPAELAEYCGERLAAFKVPRYWQPAGDLRRTDSERAAPPCCRASMTRTITWPGSAWA
jgi:hypothetical protein